MLEPSEEATDALGWPLSFWELLGTLGDDFDVAQEPAQVRDQYLLDTIIAAHAMALGAILVTDNTAEFGRVAGLRCEDWV